MLLESLRKKTNELIDKAEEVAGAIQNKAGEVATSIKGVVAEHLPDEEKVQIHSGNCFARVIAVDNGINPFADGALQAFPSMSLVGYVHEIDGVEYPIMAGKNELAAYEKLLKEAVRNLPGFYSLSDHNSVIVCITGYDKAFVVEDDRNPIPVMPS